jgi:hypothetical protein
MQLHQHASAGGAVSDHLVRLLFVSLWRAGDEGGAREERFGSLQKVSQIDCDTHVGSLR